MKSWRVTIGTSQANLDTEFIGSLCPVIWHTWISSSGVIYGDRSLDRETSTGSLDFYILCEPICVSLWDTYYA
jgi:hypothetical protein